MSDAFIDILLVEDNPTEVLLMQKIFEGANIPNVIRVAEDGECALEMLRDESIEKPDLILMDINMPKKDGKQVLQEIKADDALKHLPVIILTSSRSDKDVLECYRLYANSFVAKPTRVEEHKKLLQAVEAFWFGLAELPGEALKREKNRGL